MVNVKGEGHSKIGNGVLRMQKRSMSKVKVIQKWETLSCRRDSWTYREVVSPERVILTFDLDLVTLTVWPWAMMCDLTLEYSKTSGIEKFKNISIYLFAHFQFMRNWTLIKKKNSKQIKDAEFHSTAALRQRSDPKTNKDIKVRAFESPMSFCGLYCRKNPIPDS